MNTNQLFRVLVINPGSTSTKVGIFEEETLLYEETIRHEKEDFAGCQTILAQENIRCELVIGALAKSGVAGESLAAIVGRGGILRPVVSGTYLVNPAMVADLKAERAKAHASSLGGLIAVHLGEKYGLPAYVVDPVVVDELAPIARFSGLPGAERTSAFHALNAKASARRCAEDMGKTYETSRIIVAHMGGGITVSAHLNGQVVDVNNAITGEGPFSPERCGGLPFEAVVNLAFSGEYTKDQLLALQRGKGGLVAYLGTADLRQAYAMADEEPDSLAAHVVSAMAYQVCKEIGAMAAVLEGEIDKIVLTGGLAYSERFTKAIGNRVVKFAPICIYPGEEELRALALGALRVLKGEEKAKEYR